MNAKKVPTVRIRIRRMGDHWATCGIGVQPPDHMSDHPARIQLCPPLVPGQVIDLPANHPLVRQTRHIERVAEPEEDEFVRPWVFNSAEAALLANPSLSGLRADQIESGLALTQGAIDHQAKKLQKRQEAIEDEYGDDEHDEDYEGDNVGDEYDEDREYDEDDNEQRAQNRELRSLKNSAIPVDDDEPVVKRGAKKPARKPSVRKR